MKIFKKVQCKITALVFTKTCVFFYCISLVLFLSGAAMPPSPIKPPKDYESRSLSNPNLQEFMDDVFGNEVKDLPNNLWDLEELTLASFYYHPDLDLARAQYAISYSGIKRALANQNWLLQSQPRYSSNPRGGISPWYTQHFLSFVFETGGKKKHRFKAARHSAEASHLNIVQAAWQVRSRLRTNLVSTLVAKKKIDLLEKALEQQNALVKGMEKRVSVGENSGQDLILAKIKYQETQQQLDATTKLYQESFANLASSIGITVDALEKAKLDDSWLESPELIEGINRLDLRKEALQGRMDVKALIEEYEAAISNVRLAASQKYPDIRIGPGYLWNQEQNFWALVFDLFSPNIFSSKGAVEEALTLRDKVAIRFNALQAKIISDIDNAYLSYESALDEFKSSGELLSISNKQKYHVEKQLEFGEVDLLSLKQAEFDSNLISLSNIDALERTQLSLGLIEDAIQRPISDIRPAVQQLEFNPRKEESNNEKIISTN